MSNTGHRRGISGWSKKGPKSMRTTELWLNSSLFPFIFSYVFVTSVNLFRHRN